MRPGRFVWGLAIIILGALFLAASLGWIGWGFVWSLVQLWPVILILVGIHFLLGRSQPTLAAIIMGVVLLASVAVAWGLWGAGFGAREELAITGPSAVGITEGNAKITVAASRLTLEGGDIETVAAGSYRLWGDMRLEQSDSNGIYRLELEPTGRAWFTPGLGGGGRDQGLRLTLKSGIPWSITVNGGAASLELDLSQITLRQLQLNTGASSAHVTVGQDLAAGARLDIAGGVGSYRISLPRSLSVTVRSQSGLTSTRAEGFQSEGGVYFHQGGGPALEVSIKTGVSSVRLELY